MNLVLCIHYDEFAMVLVGMCYIKAYIHVSKEEGWWVVLGSRAELELHALNRISFSTHLTAELVLPTGAVFKAGWVSGCGHGWGNNERCTDLNRRLGHCICFHPDQNRGWSCQLGCQVLSLEVKGF